MIITKNSYIFGEIVKKLGFKKLKWKYMYKHSHKQTTGANQKLEENNKFAKHNDDSQH